MPTTIVRLAGPMLAWPAPSRYRTRHTQATPTFSALRGMFAAAEGVKRGEPLPEWIGKLELAVRVENPGVVGRDFHTVNPPDMRHYSWLNASDRKKIRTVVTADGVTRNNPLVTNRFYREDATYMLFVDDPEESAKRALCSPEFAIYSGRKACPLTFPLVLGVVNETVQEALSIVPSVSGDTMLQCVLFTAPEAGNHFRIEELPDQPMGPVGSGYAMKTRYLMNVNPPRVASWDEVVEAVNVA